MSNTKASSHQMADPFLYAEQPTSKPQGSTQAGTRQAPATGMYRIRHRRTSTDRRKFTAPYNVCICIYK